MDTTVRRAKFADLDSLISFAAEEARESEGIEKTPATLRTGILSALENEELALYWVLADGADRPVGVISAIREWSDWNAGFYWWVQSLYIAPDYRGRGYLAALFDAVREEARRQGGLDLRLYVYVENERARAAYRKNGFAEMKYRIMKNTL
jgi:GNAT superfamily N-acetyltransferase